jgi:hypothetical protein
MPTSTDNSSAGRWECFDTWVARWEQARDPDDRRNCYSRDPGNLIVKVED